MTTHASQEATAMVTALSAAQTLDDLDALYVKWIGYSTMEDDPSQTPDEVRAVLRDYIKEFCYSTGTHCGLVGL